MSDWTEKYRPRTLDGVLGNPSAVNSMRNWAKSWEKGIPDKRALVLIGSPGVGKTTSALALAEEMGWDVVEMNASDHRTEGEIERIALRGSVFNTFDRDGNYSSASEGKRKLIILDEADNFFGRTDYGAYPAVGRLIKNTKQPVILIVNDFYELKRRSDAAKNDTLQITFKKTSAASMIKALRRIAESEGVTADQDALEIIASDAAGDMRAAVRYLESLSLGTVRITSEMAAELSGRDTRKDMYALMYSIFRKSDPSEARRVYSEIDSEPSDTELWIDDNMPYEYTDKGDLVRGYEALCRADIFLGRVHRRQYYRFWAYAGDIMTMGVAAARMSPGHSYERIRFPSFLSKMSRSKAVRSIRGSLVSKISVAYHTSTNRASSDILPYMKILASGDPEFRLSIAGSLGLEPAELAFLLDSKIDSAPVRAVFKELSETEEKRRLASQIPRRSAVLPEVPDKASAMPSVPEKPAVAEKPSAPKQKGQKSLFDFRGGCYGSGLQRSSDKTAVPHIQGSRRGQAVPLDEGEHASREALLQTGFLRHQKPQMSADDSRSERMQPYVLLLLEDPGT